jgi:hypothetical protein
MAFLDDFAVPSNGNIRHVSGSTIYTLEDFHNGVQEAAAELTGSGDDTISITTDFDPSTQENSKTIIILNDIFNVDQTATEFLKGGSISQSNTDDIWGGLKVIGGVATATDLKIAQDGSYLTQFWPQSSGTGDILEILVQFKSGGSLIDNGDIQVVADKPENTLATFDVTLGSGEAPAAIATSDDTKWSNSNSGDPLALTEFDNFDEVYDAAKAWKALSLTNFNFPSAATRIAFDAGTILDWGNLTNVVLDSTAGSNFAVVTGTSTATIKTAATLATGTAFLNIGGAASFTVQGATIISGGVDIGTGGAWTIPSPARITGTITMTGTGTLTLNDLTSDQLSGTLASGNKIVVVGAATATELDARNLVFDASSVIENDSSIDITVRLTPGQQAPTKLETDGTITFDTSSTFTIQLPNIIDGSNYQIKNTTTDTILTYGTVSGGSGIDESYNSGTDFTAGDNGRVRIQYQSGVTAKDFIEVVFSFPSDTSTSSNPIAQTDFEVYNDNGTDGSTFTEFTWDSGNIEIDITDPDNKTTVQNLAAWMTYFEGTATGIDEAFGSIVWENVNSVRVVTAIAGITLDNKKVTPLIIEGGRMYRDDGTTVIASASNSIHIDYDPVYTIDGSGSSVWSEAEKDGVVANSANAVSLAAWAGAKS